MARSLRSQLLISQAVLLFLTAAAVITQGFHPFAEDGGLYAAGVQAALDPLLFPSHHAFASQHTAWNLFAPLLAGTTHRLHTSLHATLLLYYVATMWLLLFSAWRLARVTGFTQSVSLGTAALTAAWASLPVAGTSLLLMDPYVTTRSFSTPLTLLAISFVVQACGKGPRKRPYAAAALVTLVLAALMHPLMAGYGTILCALMVLFAYTHSRARACLAAVLVAFCAVGMVNATAVHCTAACKLAAHSRDYWFPARWQWFEWIGVAAPLAAFSLALRLTQARTTRALLHACLCLGGIAVVVALVFCRWDATSFAVTRLQPLRAFLPIYAVFITGLAASAAHRLQQNKKRSRRLLLTFAAAGLCALFGISAIIQDSTYPSSRHLEMPGTISRNPWVQAFLWLRDNTPQSSVIALDAGYASSPGEEAQNARAWSRRSTLPDYAKDGGAAADVPVLAPEWVAAAQAQQNLNSITDAQRIQRLAPWHVDWIVLAASAPTGLQCPYSNPSIKLCRLPSR